VWPNFTTGSPADRQPDSSTPEASESVPGEQTRHPLHVRLRIIVGVSLLLWAPLAAAAWVVFA
jgi:hypothetical protein